MFFISDRFIDKHGRANSTKVMYINEIFIMFTCKLT